VEGRLGIFVPGIDAHPIVTELLPQFVDLTAARVPGSVKRRRATKNPHRARFFGADVSELSSMKIIDGRNQGGSAAGLVTGVRYGDAIDSVSAIAFRDNTIAVSANGTAAFIAHAGHCNALNGEMCRRYADHFPAMASRII
jgi:hypothetical protein